MARGSPHDRLRVVGCQGGYGAGMYIGLGTLLIIIILLIIFL
jgi:hypothetical protein